MQTQNYTKDELLQALDLADLKNDVAAVNEIAGMLDELDKAQGYQPQEFVSPESYRKVLERAGKTIEDVPEYFKELDEKARAGEITDEELALYGTLSKRGLLGTGLELVGTGVSLAAREVSSFIPDSIEKKAVDTTSNIVQKLSEIPLVEQAMEAMQDSYQSYMQWKAEHPREGQAVESVINVAEVFAPPLRRKPIPDQTKLRTAADKQFDRAKHLETKQRRDYLNDLITPISTKANDEARAARMQQDAKGRNVYNPTDEEIEMVNILKKMPVSSKNSLVGNRNVIDSQIETTHKSLVKDLKKSKFKFNKKELSDELEKIVDDLQETNPVLVGDASAVAKKLFTKAQQLINETDGSPAQLMEVRRELDRWIKKQGKGSFDGNESAYTVAQRAVRDFLNTKVSESVPQIPVQEKLRKQHLLLRVNDRLLPKAAQEADTKLGRLAQNIAKATDTTLPKTPLGKVATVTAGAGILASAGFAGALPALTVGIGAGALGYAFYRGSISPSLRKAISASLRETDKVLSSKISREMREAIQADRVILVEAMKLPTAPEGADEDE